MRRLLAAISDHAMCLMMDWRQRRHRPLLAPNHGRPTFAAERVLFAASAYDRIVRASDVAALSKEWAGSDLLVEPQGHFGYRLMKAIWRRLHERRLLER